MLIKFFDWRGASPPEECADETLDRLACRLEAESVVDVQGYAYGIARLVLLEHRRRPIWTAMDDTPDAAGATTGGTPALTARDEARAEHEERRHACFDRCLAALPDDQRALVLGYYEGERHAKIANRRRLASSLGLSENALRSRVQRVRDRLEQCVLACASSPDAAGDGRNGTV